MGNIPCMRATPVEPEVSPAEPDVIKSCVTAAPSVHDSFDSQPDCVAPEKMHENRSHEHPPEQEPVEAIGSFASDRSREKMCIRIINTRGIVTDYMEFAEEIETISYCDHYECPPTPTTHVMVNSYIGEGVRTEPRKTPLP